MTIQHLSLNTKRLLGCTTIWLATIIAWAVPAIRRPFTVVNSDGTVMTLLLVGDENFHFYATLDGTPVVQEENGDYRLAPEMSDSIHNAWSAKSRRRNLHRMEKVANIKRRTPIATHSSYTGKKKGIVILVNFRDLSLKSTSTPKVFNRMFNERGYSDNAHYGSVHDYFYDQSYGKFDLTFDVFGPITLDNDFSHYGQNNSQGEDMYVATMAAETCQTADNAYDINWADYDWDGDGEVDQVFILYAGYGEHAGAKSTTVWPHEWTLTEGKDSHDGTGPITLGGCTIDTYAMTCELQGTSGSKLNGIGTACHEFSHCLGLPDFYDTSYNGGFGMDAWDVMDIGSENGLTGWGECPAGYTAYERWFAGWLELTELDKPTTIQDMPNIADEPVAYAIYNDGNRNEFFILENRQNQGWFQYVKTNTDCHGMLVSHVDYDADAWGDNNPNNDALHQRMSIVPAGKNYGKLMGSSGNRGYHASAEEYRSQLFPGNQDVTELTNTSHTSCGGKLFNKNTDGTYNLNKPITDIRENYGLISFNFMGGEEETSIAEVTEQHPQTATYYTLDGTLVKKPSQKGFYIERKNGKTRKILIK